MVKIAIPQMGNSLFRKYMKSKYAQSLDLAGACTEWIELEDVNKAVNEALTCDGLLLPGGADLNPKMYGETPIEACGKPNELRDSAEPKILKAFLDTGKPIFCICRGIQMLCVCSGGKLIQDIKPNQKYNHADFMHRAHTTHPVEITKNSKLYNIIGKEKINVNSMHHQTVLQPGKDIVVSAMSADGYIEAVEMENYDFCIGVQWHPEHMSKKSEEQRRLFSAFVKACRCSSAKI